MVLVPATMALLGDRNWWMPRFLDRLVPRLTIEPTVAIVPSDPVALDREPELEPATGR
jgi:RND superfamily putative drug exporter